MSKSEYLETVLIQIWEDQLQREYDYYNWVYKLHLIRPQFKIVDVSGYLAQWDPLLKVMKFSLHLIQNHSWYIVLEILKHEIAHQLITVNDIDERGHGPQFKRFCQQIGVDYRFQRAQVEININNINFESSKGFESTSVTDIEGKRLMEKIEKLLSLAQSKNQNEALAAMEKVNELYEKYNIDRISRKIEENEYTFLSINLKSVKMKAHYSVITSILMQHFFVDVVISRIYDIKRNQNHKTIEIFGTRENLLIAEYVFHYLDQAVEELWNKQAEENKLQIKYKRSFQLGLLHGFNAKMQKSKEVRHKNQPNSLISNQLILLRNDPGLNKFISSKYPRLKGGSNSTGSVYGSVFSKGMKDGEQIIINKGISKSQNGPLFQIETTRTK